MNPCKGMISGRECVKEGTLIPPVCAIVDEHLKDKNLEIEA
jgi:hypothetical protein